MKDAELVAALPLLVQRENEHKADLLAHLAELDERRLYLELGFRSMWEYCTVALEFCETTAWRRYTAARVCRRFPAAFELVARGELQLSVLAALAKHLTADNANELFEACGRQSIRRVEALLAARSPVPDVADSVRRLPRKRDEQHAPVEPVEHARVESVAHPAPITSGAGCAPLTPPTPPTPPGVPNSRGRVEPLSADRFAIRFTADTQFLQLLEQVRDLASHRDASGELLSTMKAGLTAYRRELLKRRFAVGTKPRATKTAAQRTTGSRQAAPAAVAREVYERDGGQCTYVAPDGRRCSSRRSLELDHIEPRAVGGDATCESLRLRCRAHNQHYARQYFGRGYMRAVMKRARVTRSA